MRLYFFAGFFNLNSLEIKYIYENNNYRTTKWWIK